MALNNPQGLICHKTQPTNLGTGFWPFPSTYLSFFSIWVPPFTIFRIYKLSYKRDRPRVYPYDEISNTELIFNKFAFCFFWCTLGILLSFIFFSRMVTASKLPVTCILPSVFRRFPDFIVLFLLLFPFSLSLIFRYHHDVFLNAKFNSYILVA